MLGLHYDELPEDLKYVLEHGGYREFAETAECDFAFRPFDLGW